MLSLLLFLFGTFSYSQSYLFRCDFETPCANFSPDQNWGLTDGLHPRPIDHDHTLNDPSGHYLFYNPSNRSRSLLAEIKTTDWIQSSIDRVLCFQMWYYTSESHLPFNIQVVQGDDELLTRIVASIPGKDPSINDWTQINVTLPAEKIKIYIRLNATAGPLVFDDLTVDYCDGPRPSPAKTLLACDFESSCTDNFISLPYYPYQWSIIQASDAVKQISQAPPMDYTFGNRSGHYAWLANYDLIQQGKVGYLATRSILNISANESYCLNFEYYQYGRSLTGNLIVYLSTPDGVQVLWPKRSSGQYTYTMNQWTWGIINLPVGSYSLLFRMDSTDIIQSSFTLDNIAITSCTYPSSQLAPSNYLLSFSCNFDNLTMCDMMNGDGFSTSLFNLTVVTGDTVPNRELGPTRDHTSNSSSGAFLYWDRQLPFTSGDSGVVHPPKKIEQNLGMCIRFAYYVKALAGNNNRTKLTLNAGGCYGSFLWFQFMSDSHGWQVVTVPVKEFACLETFYFVVNQYDTFPVSVAFDDIEIDQCSSFEPTTTTTITTTPDKTTTISSSTIEPTTTQLKSTTSLISTTSKMSTSTTQKYPSSTSPRSNARHLLSVNQFVSLTLCFLSIIIGQFSQ